MEIPDGNLFLYCEQRNPAAFSALPEGYTLRFCREEELPLWMALHFDSPAEAEQNRPYMEEFFGRVYAPRGDEFFRRCRLLCGPDGKAAGSCFLWESLCGVETVHWFKVKKELEGRGLGRALLSETLRGAKGPLLLHTQPGSYRAIGLYAAFGFALLTDPAGGRRQNALETALPVLREVMTPEKFALLRTRKAPEPLILAAAAAPYSDF